MTMAKEKEAKELLKQIFTRLFPNYGYHVRKNQIELAEEVLKALQGLNIALCEAEVGTGKTHAYIIASVLNSLLTKNQTKIRNSYPITEEFFGAKMPTIISTSSIALQKAIVHDYIPEISRVLLENGVITKPLSAVIRKGKGHYICDMRLFDCISGMGTKKDKEEYLPLLELQDLPFNEIDLDNFNHLSAYIKRKISVTNNCSAVCHQYETCRYSQFMRYAKGGQHDFQVCNHNYFFADTLRREKGQRALIPNYAAVIIDEAHKLVDVARQMYGTSITSLELKAMVSQAIQLVFKDKKASREFVLFMETLDRYVFRLFAELIKSVPINLLSDENDVFRYKIGFNPNSLELVKGIIVKLDPVLSALGTDLLLYKNQENKMNHLKRQLKTLKSKLQFFWIQVTLFIGWKQKAL